MPNSQAASGTDQAGNTPSGKHGKTDEKKSRLLHILPKLPSTDSLSNSPGPSSPGTYKSVYLSTQLCFIFAFTGITSVIDVSCVDKVGKNFYPPAIKSGTSDKIMLNNCSTVC